MAASKQTRPEQQRLAARPFPLPLFPIGSKVQVYLGAGWSTAYVVNSGQDKCQVRLSVGNRVITVFDARSIKKSEK